MNVRRLIFGFLILTCGFLAGLILTGRMRATADAANPPAPPPLQQGTAARATVASSSPVAGLPDFTVVAERAVPAVANISSTQVIARQNSPYSNDPFFRYFFGDDNDLFGP